MNDPSYCLRRAYRRLIAAETLMADDASPEDAINRLYYAAREAALAIMAHLDLDVEAMPRTHRVLRVLFHDEVMQKGLMDPNCSRELAIWSSTEHKPTMVAWTRAKLIRRSKQSSTPLCSSLRLFVSCLFPTLRRLKPD